MTRPDNRAMILIAEKYGFVQQSITSGDDKNPLLLIKNIKVFVVFVAVVVGGGVFVRNRTIY